MKILHVDHIGIVVGDLKAASDFFIDLGFTLMGKTTVEGEWAGRVIGLGNIRSDVVMLQAPDIHVNIELSKFHRPEAIANTQPAATNILGFRHIALQVEDLDGIVSNLRSKGVELVGEVETYQGSWKLCYIRGPEGIFVELAEQLDR